jgi:hypothetical protein
MKKIITTITLLLIISTSFAQIATWTNAGGNSLFNNAANWSTGSVPTTTNDVVYDGTSNSICNINTTVNVKSITVANTYSSNIVVGIGFNITTLNDYTWNSTGFLFYSGGIGITTIGGNLTITAGGFLSNSGTLIVGGNYSQTGTANTVSFTPAGKATFNGNFNITSGSFSAPRSQINKGDFIVTSGGTYNSTGVNDSIRIIAPNATIQCANPLNVLVLENKISTTINTYAINGIVTLLNNLIYDFSSTFGSQAIVTNKIGAVGTLLVKNKFSVLASSSGPSNLIDGGDATIEFNSNSLQNIIVNSSSTNYSLCNVLITGPARTIKNSQALFQNYHLCCMDFKVAASGPITLQTSISLKGDFTNDGNLILPAMHQTTFRGGAANQNIYSTATTTFYTLNIRNTGGFTVKQQSNVDLTNGMFIEGVTNSRYDVNGNMLTFKSSASRTAQLTTATAATQLVGNFTMERYIKGTTTGWTLLGSPFGTQSTLADWIDDFAMSGFTGSTGAAQGFVSMITYDETKPGPVGAAAKYIDATNITNVIGKGKGWWAYVGTGLGTTADITLDITGNLQAGVNFGSVNIPVTYTLQNGAPGNADDGWNLIANPFPAALDFNAFQGTPNNNTTRGLKLVYNVYNADLGADAVYLKTSSTAGISTPAIGAGGVGRYIPSSQGFNVQVSSLGNLVATEAQKASLATGDVNLLIRKKNIDTTEHYFRIKMLNTNDSRVNDCVINFSDDASTGIDDLDALRFKTMVDTKADMLIMTQLNGKDFAINSLKLDTVNITTIPVSMRVGTTQNYTISATDFATVFPSTYCVKLIDHKLNTTTNLRTQTYTTTLDSLDNSLYRFDVVIVPNAGLTVDAVINTPLPNTVVGSAQINPTVVGNYNFYLINAITSSKIDSVLNATNATFGNLTVGNYKVQATLVNGNLCSVAETMFTMDSSAIFVTRIASNQNNNAVNTYYANGSVMIKTNTSYENATVIVYNAIGQQLASKKITMNGQTEYLTLTDVSAQAVFVTIVSNTINYTNKLILAK